MVNTTFANPHGLPNSRNISTARDLAILSRAIMRDYPQYYRLFATKNFAFRGQNIRNHNGLLYRMEGVDGLKTGYINASGYNLAVSAVRDGRRLIAIVMGGPTVATRDKVAESLLLTGFDVLDRRARGEQITIAQNFFEPPALAQSTVPSMQQGDTERGLDIALASSTPPGRASDIRIVEAGSVPQLNGRERGDPSGRWIVQVGAFKSRADARKQLSISEKRFGDIFGDARGTAQRDGGKYTARFSGFSEREARDACRTLKAKKQPCMVVPPGRG